MTEFDPPRRRTRSASASTQAVYHTTDCRAYKLLSNWTEVTEREKEWRVECSYCAGEADQPAGVGKAVYKAALEHDPDGVWEEP